MFGSVVGFDGGLRLYPGGQFWDAVFGDNYEVGRTLELHVSVKVEMVKSNSPS